MRVCFMLARVWGALSLSLTGEEGGRALCLQGCGRALSLSLSLTGKEGVCGCALWRKREGEREREREMERERETEGERETGRERGREM